MAVAAASTDVVAGWLAAWADVGALEFGTLSTAFECIRGDIANSAEQVGVLRAK